MFPNEKSCFQVHSEVLILWLCFENNNISYLIFVSNLIIKFPVDFVSKLCFQVNFTNVPPFGFVIVTCKVTITEPGKVMT